MDDQQKELIWRLLHDKRYKHRPMSLFLRELPELGESEIRQYFEEIGARQSKSKDGRLLWTQPGHRPSGSKSEETRKKGVSVVIGKTWPDLVSDFPIWMLSAAALIFAGILLFSVTYADRPYSLGFLGTFGPPNKDISKGVGGPLPTGAVVAFNSTRNKPCPDGWSPFHPAISRVIVGAGHPGVEEIPRILTPRLSYKDDRSIKKTSAQGGEERVAMTKPEMPKHGHGVGSLSVTTNSNFIHRTDDGMSVNANLRVKHGLLSSKSGPANFGGHMHLISGETALIGEGKPHNNMPPYIALYYCKKN